MFVQHDLSGDGKLDRLDGKRLINELQGLNVSDLNHLTHIGQDPEILAATEVEQMLSARDASGGTTKLNGDDFNV